MLQDALMKAWYDYRLSRFSMEIRHVVMSKQTWDNLVHEVISDGIHGKVINPMESKPMYRGFPVYRSEDIEYGEFKFG
jgi:hypothetical protein